MTSSRLPEFLSSPAFFFFEIRVSLSILFANFRDRSQSCHDVCLRHATTTSDAAGVELCFLPVQQQPGGRDEKIVRQFLDRAQNTASSQQ